MSIKKGDRVVHRLTGAEHEVISDVYANGLVMTRLRGEVYALVDVTLLEEVPEGRAHVHESSKER